MKKNEFDMEYLKLEEIQPEIYSKPLRKQMIATAVADMDHKWFASLVKRIILTPNLKIDFDEAARSERVNRLQLEKTKQIIKESDSSLDSISSHGLTNVLKMFKANSLQEAIQNSKKLKG